MAPCSTSLGAVLIVVPTERSESADVDMFINYR
jgi:hypothetical protein